MAHLLRPHSHLAEVVDRNCAEEYLGRKVVIFAQKYLRAIFFRRFPETSDRIRSAFLCGNVLPQLLLTEKRCPRRQKLKLRASRNFFRSAGKKVPDPKLLPSAHNSDLMSAQ